jgi:hypothetical protein
MYTLLLLSLLPPVVIIVQEPNSLRVRNSGGEYIGQSANPTQMASHRSHSLRSTLNELASNAFNNGTLAYSLFFFLSPHFNDFLFHRETAAIAICRRGIMRKKKKNR